MSLLKWTLTFWSISLVWANTVTAGNHLTVSWLSQDSPSSNHSRFCFIAKKVKSCNWIWCHSCHSCNLCTRTQPQCHPHTDEHILVSLMAAMHMRVAWCAVLANCWKHEYSSPPVCVWTECEHPGNRRKGLGGLDVVCVCMRPPLFSCQACYTLCYWCVCQ